METILQNDKILSDEELHQLKLQDSRVVDEFKANLLELNARKHWDVFYKRNETKFFKDRHWSIREFSELVGASDSSEKRVLLEVGCGVGNFLYPLIQENVNCQIFACDLSPRAVQLVKSNPLYEKSNITVFCTDITTEEIFEHVQTNSFDIITIIFVLSAIHPVKFEKTLKNLYKLLKPYGIILFRDYGLYDMAQLRFKAGNKIAENFYMRHDGTRSFFFSTKFAEDLFCKVGLEILENSYIHRRTINKKENLDVPRIFLQVKAKKPG